MTRGETIGRLGDEQVARGVCSFRCNALEVSCDGADSQRLSAVLRDNLACRDVKIGCNAGDCGACTVLLDGAPVCACLTAVGQARGREVETVQGLERSEPLMRQLQQSFLRHGAAQCGICTPGMLVSAVALLRQVSEPDEQAVQDALGGVLCRCTGYRKIIDAVRLATQVDAAPAEQDDTGQVRSLTERRQPVGLSLQRLDGQAKVSGLECFGDDVAPVDARVCRLLRSPFHHASFVLGDLDAYKARHPGIEAILCARDIPGQNAFGVIPPYIDQPVFAEDCARFKGEAVAAIIGLASTMESLDLSDFPVTWTEEPALLDPIQSSRPDAAQLHSGTSGNTLCEGLVQRGDAEAGLAQAFKVAGATFNTGFIEHAYIEPEAGFARRVGDTIEVHGCTQAPYMNRDSLARIMGLDETAVRIVPTAVGGGFGSKLDLTYQPCIALAAWILNVPVRMTFSRQESMQSSTKRHPSRLEVEIGIERSGRLCGFRFDGTFNTGAYASWGPTVANRVPVHASGPYFTPNYRAHTVGVYTHCAPAGAFRGFGVPQAAIAQESLFDELAESIGMDRLAFRLLNALDNDQPTVTGQTFESAVGIKPCLQALQDAWSAALADAESFNRLAMDSGLSLRRGVGIACGWYGCGNTSLPNPSTIRAGIRADGRICLHQGAMDIGQGSNTVITQIFAQALGVSVADIVLLGADSALTPDAGKTSASRQTFVTGQAARLSALALRRQIARLTNCATLQELDIRQNVLHVNPASADTSSIDLQQLPINEFGYVLMAEESFDPPTSPMDENGQGIPYAQYGYAAQMVSLDVDTQLGTVQLQSLIAAHDVGRAINPLLVEGQIHGGVAQGIGLALMEEFIPGRTENLHDYLIPTIGDIPPIKTIIVEVEDPHGPFGAKGLGEHVLIPTAPAILNAITHACGVRIRHLPATPDKVLAAIRDQGSQPR
ncbi:molybdopterin-dependent oxidoreductase [Granulosicoccus sp. 3-233]|uniref:molybdopterin-dependent oxidoreductase n=1 Tax=Granulosicoccus sp. 3-233 TaxID=3417969 RepID=UPI003D33EF4F